MMKKLAVCSVACLMLFGFVGTVSSQDGSGEWTWGEWMDESPPIVEFVKNYYGYMLNTILVNHEPSDEEPGLDWGREWFADDCQMIVRTHFEYEGECETCEHEAGEPWDCECAGVYCGQNDPKFPGGFYDGDGVKAVLHTFAGHYPGMLHDRMDLIYRPIGKNVWWVWTRYEYKATYHDIPTGEIPDPDNPICINFPGCTILTVDMNQRRSDGGKGRITKIDITWDNLVYETQLGNIGH